MGKFPVHQSPELDQVEARMRPTPTFLHGFLGDDPRKLVQILEDDEARVASLGLSHQEIAKKLREITEIAKSGLGDPVLIENRYFVRISTARGKIPCPWAHPGLYPKTDAQLQDKVTGETLQWSDLAIHMIEQHGFYQGRGSRYRLEPEKIQKILFQPE